MQFKKQKSFNEKLAAHFSSIREMFPLLSLLLMLIVLPVTSFLVLQQQTTEQHASGTTITISNTAVGTMQTQLSTNLVTWGADFTQIPNGQANLNTLQLPLIRLHVGDDGGAAMPEVSQGNWDMSTINTMVNDVFASGQQPLMNIKFAPDWMWTCYPNSIGVNGKQGTGTVKDLSFQTFAQYMARLASYYNKGSLTEENGTVLINPAGTSHKITYWELWNEPDLNNETPCAPSSGVGLTATQYLTMWNAVTSAMLSIDPTIKFVGPATAGGQFGSGGGSGNAYIDNIMGSGTTVKPYAASFHGYGYWAQVADKWFFDGDGTQGGGGITDMVTSVKAVRSLYPALPLWLTEVNVNADWGAAGQNDDELAAAWWGAMFQQLAPFNVEMIHQFDFSGSNLFGLIDGEGISNKDATGNPMLPYYVLQQIDKAFPQGSTILQSSSAQTGILSLAAKKPDGTISVMVINREISSNTIQSKCGSGGVAETVTVDLSALNPTSITNTQIDKNNINCTTWYGIAPTTQNLPPALQVTLNFPGYGIAILNVTTVGNIATATPTIFGQLPSPTTQFVSPTGVPTLTTKPTLTPKPTSISTPTPTLNPLGGSTLIIYDNAVESNFKDNTFSYSSKNTCDTSTYVSSPCSYAATFQPYGAYEFISKIGSLDPTKYKSLDYNIDTGGQSISNFGITIGTLSGGWINEIRLSSANVTGDMGNGWVHIAVPFTQLDPKNKLFGSIDLENALNKSIGKINVDDVQLTSF